MKKGKANRQYGSSNCGQCLATTRTCWCPRDILSSYREIQPMSQTCKNLPSRQRRVHIHCCLQVGFHFLNMFGISKRRKRHSVWKLTTTSIKIPSSPSCQEVSTCKRSMQGICIYTCFVFYLKIKPNVASTIQLSNKTLVIVRNLLAANMINQNIYEIRKKLRLNSYSYALDCGTRNDFADLIRRWQFFASPYNLILSQSFLEYPDRTGKW